MQGQRTLEKCEWPRFRLEDVATKIGSGSTPRGGEAVYVKAGTPLIRSMNVRFEGLRAEGLVYINQVEADKLRNVTVQTDDVLLNITGASIGRVTTATEEMAGARVNQHVCIIRPKADLLPKFLAYFFASPSEQSRIMRVQVGATRQALTKQMIENWQVPAPPLEEQKRVVAEIEKQFTRLEAGIAALRRSQANLKRYRAAILKSACEGSLVENEVLKAKAEGRCIETGEQLLKRVLNERRQTWQGRGKFKDPLGPRTANQQILPPGWTWATFEQISERVTVGFVGSMRHEYVSSGVPFLRGQNVRENRFDLEGLLYIRPEFHRQLSKSAIKPGDLAIVRSGSVGVTCVIPETLPDANCSDLVLIKRPMGFVPQYGAYFMNSLAKRHIEAGKVGIALTHFNTKSVAALPVPLPPIAEQTRIVAEVERRLSVIAEQYTTANTNLQRAEKLRQSILANAYRSSYLEPTTGAVESIKKQWTPQFLRHRNRDIHKFTTMKKNSIQTEDELLELVRSQKSGISPENLCVASGFNEDVEMYFDLLRSCRNKGLLIVPSGKKATIRIAKL